MASCALASKIERLAQAANTRGLDASGSLCRRGTAKDREPTGAGMVQLVAMTRGTINARESLGVLTQSPRVPLLPGTVARRHRLLRHYFSAG